MFRTIIILVLLVCSVSLIRAETVSLSGTVQKAGAITGLAGVKVGLVGSPTLTATTGADGSFTISGATSVTTSSQQIPTLRFSLRGNTLVFAPIPLKIDKATMNIFAGNGKLLFSCRINDLSTPQKSVTLPELPSGISTIQLSLGGSSYTRKIICLDNAVFIDKDYSKKTGYGNLTLSKHTASTAVDTLTAEKKGYITAKKPLDSYTRQNLLIELDTLNATGGKCTREILEGAAESYITAQEAGDLSKMSLAPQVEYRENMKETTKEKGVWNTALPVAFHRNFLDVDSCRTFTEVIVTKGGKPYVIGTRLRVEDGSVSGMETIVTKEGDWLFDADKYLTKSKGEEWGILPVDQRTERQKLINAANAYLQLFAAPYKDTVPWGTPCNRLEGGQGYTSGSCKTGIPDDQDQAITERTFVVDVDMGSVVVYCLFYFTKSKGLPDSHLFRLVNGKLRYVHTLTVMK